MTTPSADTPYEIFHAPGQIVPIKAWTKGVPVEAEAREQLRRLASLPFVHRHVAVMPDVHVGIGATIGSVVPTKKAIVPAAVGVDIGCGMMAVKTTLRADDLPDDLKRLRTSIERAVPHGRTSGRSKRDHGAFQEIPARQLEVWRRDLGPRFERIAEKHGRIRNSHHLPHLGTLGTGNHFIEMCLDEANAVWIVLHSGSRGVGNRIGTYFIELARKDMGVHLANLPDRDLAYLEEGTEHFDDYVEAVGWAQDFAMANRRLMMAQVVETLSREKSLPGFRADVMAVNCHHNYVARERHFGEDVLVTRKGAVRAGRDDLGIIPGSMGARTYIVRGRGNPESFESCSHGAGRVMSRTAAKKAFSVEDHRAATAGVECRKDARVIDETPMAYKDIDAVLEAQKDLVEVLHTLKQVVCVKG